MVIMIFLDYEQIPQAVRLANHVQFPSQHKVGDDAQGKEDSDQGDGVHPKQSVIHGHLLQKLLGHSIVAVHLIALHLGPIHSIDGYHGT